MTDYCFSFRSVTRATQASHLLKAARVRHTMQRTPTQLRTNGCGYCIGVEQRNFSEARQILQSEEYGSQRIYRRDESGQWQEMTE